MPPSARSCRSPAEPAQDKHRAHCQHAEEHPCPAEAPQYSSGGTAPKTAEPGRRGDRQPRMRGADPPVPRQEVCSAERWCWAPVPPWTKQRHPPGRQLGQARYRRTRVPGDERRVRPRPDPVDREPDRSMGGGRGRVTGDDDYLLGHGDSGYSVRHYDLSLTYTVHGNHLSAKATLRATALTPPTRSPSTCAAWPWTSCRSTAPACTTPIGAAGS